MLLHYYFKFNSFLEVFCKWHILQRRWSYFYHDWRWRNSKSYMDGWRDLATICYEL